MRIERRRAVGRGHVDRVLPIEIPVAPRDGERIMRMAERGGDEEGPLVARPRGVEDRALGGEGDFVVEVELIGAHADARLGD